MQDISLVAHYDFHEGGGAVLHDVTGNGNDGTIVGAQWIKRRTGYCLEFNGIDNFVDCGHGPSIDLTGAVTLEAWTLLDARQGEAGIAGKHYESYFLSHYQDGRCYWYINHSGVANDVSAALAEGSWHHLAATFDGATLSLYINGTLAVAQPSNSGPAIASGQNFYIGVTNPASTPASHLKGLVGEVRLYNRALLAAEVQSHFQAGEKQLEFKEYDLAKAFAEVQQGNISVGVAKNGQVRVAIDGDVYLAESSYSHPGTVIGWNHLGQTGRSSEPGWSPVVKKTSAAAIEIEVKSKLWTLRRQVRIRKGGVAFDDHLVNTGCQPAGFNIWNRLTGRLPFNGMLAPEFADNPTIFLAGPGGPLGIVIEDDISRSNYEPDPGLPANQARFRLSNVVLDPGKGLRLQWTLHALAKGASYFDLVNIVRDDWKSNFTIDGPFAFFDANPLANPLIGDPPGLKAYLGRKRLKMVALSPWLDYDPNTFDHVLSRQEYKAVMQTAIAALKAADPAIRCLGSVETDWVNLRLDDVDPTKTITRAPVSSLPLTTVQTQLIDNANLPWKDSVKRDSAQNLAVEIYQRVNLESSLAVYPALGNYQHSFLMGQSQFLLEDVGMDGIYFDQFSQAGWVAGGIRSYDAADDWSGEVDAATGEIDARYTNCDLAGRAARAELCQYVLGKGKTVVCNTWASTTIEKTIPANRFSETWNFFDPKGIDISDFPDTGAEPAAIPTIFRGNLGSPIGLGTQAKNGVPTAKRLMKAVIAYLRHGMLYYHYVLPDIAAGQGEYGPVNLMFPITPVKLHKGWIEGEERMITCVSGVFQWKHAPQPQVHRFDLMGLEITPPGFTISKAPGGWKVDVKITDWTEVVIIE